MGFLGHLGIRSYAETRKSLTMMAHSRYGMMHLYMLDGKTDIRGYPSSAYCVSKYNVPLLDEVVNEAQLRELANWIRDHMGVYN